MLRSGVGKEILDCFNNENDLNQRKNLKPKNGFFITNKIIIKTCDHEFKADKIAEGFFCCIDVRERYDCECTECYKELSQCTVEKRV
jgi:hypothetical protein